MLCDLQPTPSGRFAKWVGRSIPKLLSALVLALALASPAALAEPRLALIIGNSNYGDEMGRLPNPANDAALMEKALKSVGFETITLIDADQKKLKRGISDFGQRLNEMGSESTGLFFYAGHGLQVKGTNYLVPVNADIRSEADVDLEAVSADTILSQMEFAGARVNIVILDACRNNPLARGFRSATRGLAKMDAPTGSFIAYSTAPGDVAADGTGANSPYTSALAASITTPGKGIEEMFREVRGEVLEKTGKEQTPWESSSLTAPFYFKAAEESSSFQTASAPDAPQATESQNQTQTAARSIDPVEEEYWNEAKTNNDVPGYEAYLVKYPDGEFAPLAKIRLERAKGANRSPEPAAEDTQVAAIDPGASIVAAEQLLYMKSKGNVRVSPTKSGKVIVQLPKNAELHVTGHTADGDWWRVALAGGNTGYVHSSLVVSQAASAAPSAAPAAETETAAAAPVASASDETYAAAPAMADRGTTTQERIVTESAPDTSAQVGAVFGGLLSGFATGQSGVVIAPQSSTTTTSRSIAPPDPSPADKKILGQLSSGNINGAFRSASDAQAADPGFWSKAAMIAFHSGKRPDMASNMARRAIQENAGYLYGWLFVALADGNGGAAQTGLESFGQNAWPAPIAELMTGQRDAKSLLAIAQKGGARAICEAGFYGTVYLKATGDAAGAASLLKAGKGAAKSCPEGAATLKLR